jgi:hypothetical protein
MFHGLFHEGDRRTVEGGKPMAEGLEQRWNSSDGGSAGWRPLPLLELLVNAFAVGLAVPLLEAPGLLRGGVRSRSPGCG